MFEKIRLQYINEAEELIRSNNEKHDLLTNPLEKLNKKAKGLDAFSHSLIDILNKILEEYNISFKNEEEKELFLEFIKPTTIELLQKNMI